uniref:Capsid protein n=2 Tax=Mamastrovirus TaxID=249588 RepID=A0A1Y0DCK6_9VIRU|nr:capsid protein [Mamastrovirus 2]
MASRQQKRQPPRNTTNIVVRNGSSSNQAGPSRAQQARRRRNRRKPQVNIRVLANQNKTVRRSTRRPGVGSRVVFQKITTTLGTVGSNGSEQIECEMTCLLNPATMKEATGSNAFGPLGIYASTYALFKMTKCELVLKPLVGDSAVSGTVVRASWNPTATPSQTSWSSLGARKHVDITPGKRGRFTLTSKDLKGPKDGWYKTNTQGDPMMAFAGALEIHTIGKTMSTYQSRAFEGGLFLAELTTEWQFKDYQQQPGMLNLVKGEDKSQARLKTDENGKMQLVLPTSSSRMARASTGSTNKTIWVVTDTIVNLGAGILPPPFSWLIRGGWWIVKRAANAPVRTGETTFDIYASISDARSDSPCVSTQANMNIELGGLHFQQITPGNVGIGDELLTITRSIDAPLPSGRPNVCYVTSAQRVKPGTNDQYVPSYPTWYSYQNQNYTTGLGFVAGELQVATYNVHLVTIATDVGDVTLDHFSNKVPIYLFHGSNREQLGYAVACRHDNINIPPSLRVSSVLIYATHSQAFNFDQNWVETTASYPVTDNGTGFRVRISTPQSNNRTNVRVKLDQGNWYVAQFVTQGIVDHQYKVGNDIIASRGTEAVVRGDHYFTPSNNTMAGGLFPSFLTGTRLSVFTTDVVTTDQGGSRRETYPVDDIHPGFGFDDASEFPPPPSEEDPAEDEDDFEDPGDLEEDESEGLELGPDDHYSDPPISRLVVRDDAVALYEQLRATHSERAARLAVNQLFPSDEYTEFTEVYHDALADGLSPRAARAQALGL